MNRNVEQRLVTVQSMMRDTQEAFDDVVNQWHKNLASDHASDHATIVAKNALEMNDKLCRALAHYYVPTVKEYRQFDEYCEAVSAAGGSPPNEESYWSELAFNRWELSEGVE